MRRKIFILILNCIIFIHNELMAKYLRINSKHQELNELLGLFYETIKVGSQLDFYTLQNYLDVRSKNDWINCKLKRISIYMNYLNILIQYIYKIGIKIVPNNGVTIRAFHKVQGRLELHLEKKYND